MWRAHLTEDRVIEQFVPSAEDPNKMVETSFSRVLNSLHDVETFSFTQGSRRYSVRLSDGRFTTTNSGISSDFYATSIRINEESLCNIRPIYFVRETVELKVGINMIGGQASPPTVNFHALGFQANLNGVNIKRYLAILPDGTYTIEDE